MHYLILKVRRGNTWNTINTVFWQTQAEKAKGLHYLSEQKDQWERTYFCNGEQLRIFEEK